MFHVAEENYRNCTLLPFIRVMALSSLNMQFTLNLTHGLRRLNTNSLSICNLGPSAFLSPSEFPVWLATMIECILLECLRILADVIVPTLAITSAKVTAQPENLSFIFTYIRSGKAVIPQAVSHNEWIEKPLNAPNNDKSGIFCQEFITDCKRNASCTTIAKSVMVYHTQDTAES